MNKVFYLLVTFLCCSNLNAQDSGLKVDAQVESIEVGHPTKAVSMSMGVAYIDRMGRDYFTTINGKFFITPGISFDAKYGFSFDKGAEDKRSHIYTFGFKYWFSNKLYRNGFSPFAGLNFWGVLVPDYDIHEGTVEFNYYYGMRTIEVPAGISYTSKSGFHTTLQLSYLVMGFEPEDFMNVELAVGWRFNFDKRKVGLASANLHAQNSRLIRDVNSMGEAHPTKAIGISMGFTYIKEYWDNFLTINGKFFITPSISLDAKYGFSLGMWSEDIQIYTLGSKYWFMNKLYRNSFSPFVGLNYFGASDYYVGFENSYRLHTIEVPAGISYTTKSGLHTTLQLNYPFVRKNREDLMHVELAVGWRFNLDKRKNTR
jgi:hypothetical protein